MPIYEYQCQSCGDRTEALQRISDPPLETCEECGGDLKKLVSAPAFQFKGSGWYVTDYARKNDKPGGSEKGDAKASNGAKTDGSSTKSSESKSPDTKSSKSKSTAAAN